MRFLQIGLGSMGKRRIRCLKKMGYHDIIAFDLRVDRNRDIKNKFGVEAFDDLKKINFKKIDAMIISTPPDIHEQYIKLAIQKHKPAFVEASVILGGLKKLAELARAKKVFIAPSCTLRFHPAVKLMKNILLGKKYGKVCNFSYHMGQYLPDWHPWEDIRDFYVSKRKTSASREMVTFELTWLTDIVGYPLEAFAFYGKTFEMGVDIEDTYNVNLKFKNCLGMLSIDVVSRFATRSLILNLEKAQVRWHWEEKVVKLYDAENKRWFRFPEPKGRSEASYNKNIIEEMYLEETSAFINALKGTRPFCNTLDDDIKILNVLEKIEHTNKGIKL